MRREPILTMNRCLADVSDLCVNEPMLWFFTTRRCSFNGSPAPNIQFAAQQAKINDNVKSENVGFSIFLNRARNIITDGFPAKCEVISGQFVYFRMGTQNKRGRGYGSSWSYFLIYLSPTVSPL